MKFGSVKRKLTGWLTVLMAVLSLMLLGFLMSVSSTVVSQTAMTQLTHTVQANLPEITMQAGKLQLGEGFTFSRGGVSTLIYSKAGTLLAGQVPVAFATDEPFASGLTRAVDAQGARYFVLDVWLPLGWESGLWVRGLMESPAQQGVARNLLYAALVALPLFVGLAALGSYRIVRRAFRPLDTITATAAAINEARDLSGRIALPPGRDEFSRLADAFDHMFERLEQSFEAEAQFTADASHELRTPLSIIRGACEYAEKFDETPEERQETLAMIHRQAVHMSELIAQLLDMTRLEQGTELPHTQAIDLGALARTVCDERGYAGEWLHLSVEAGVVVQGDKALLTRLICNLVENARKYGGEHGQVWVSVSQDARACRLTVRDDGVGIDPAVQDKVWQRFYQVDPARSGEGGAGLGLSMVRQIARVHGGDMQLQSAPGAGSTFKLVLPK